MNNHRLYQEALYDITCKNGEQMNHTVIMYGIILNNLLHSISPEKTREYFKDANLYITRVLLSGIQKTENSLLGSLSFKNRVNKHLQSNDVPDFYTMATLVCSLYHGWSGTNEEFFRIYPGLILWWWKPLYPKNSPKDQKLNDLIFVAKYKLYTTEEETHNGKDIEHDILNWVERYKKLAIFLNKSLVNMTSNEWIYYSLERLSILSICTMITLFLRSHTGSKTTEDRFILNNLLKDYITHTRPPDFIAPEPL